MAKSSSLEAARKIIADIRKGDFNPVYILMGEEAYYIDLITEFLEKNVVAEEDKDFNLNVFYGNDADIDYVVGVAQQFPVMAPRKLVLLKEAQSMMQAKVQLEKFAPYLARPSRDTVFVIAFKGDSLNATSKLIKAAKESGAIVFKSDVPRDYELNGHIKEYCKDHKFSIDDNAVNLLAQYIGAPLSKLFGEINKLMSIKGDVDRRITTEDIEKNIGVSKDYNNLELIKAVEAKDYVKAIKIVKHFSTSPKTNPTVVTTATLLNYFSNLVIAHYLPDKSDAALIQTFGFKSSYQLADFKKGMYNYNPMKAVNAIHYLREFDTKSKGVDSFFNEYDLLAELIFKIFT